MRHSAVYNLTTMTIQLAERTCLKCGKGFVIENNSANARPFHDFYARLLGKGMESEMARLTLARKIAAITLTTWKKGDSFDANQLKAQAA